MFYLPFDGKSSPSIPFTVNRASPQARGLVSWWPPLFGRGSALASDMSGSNLTGTLTSVTLDPNGTLGKAWLFNGTSSQFDMADIPTFKSSTSFSVTAWFNTNTLSGGDSNLRYLVAKEGISNASAEFMIRLDTANDKLQFYIGGGSYDVAEAVVAADTWYHMAGTYDGVNIRLYLNGLQAASTGRTGATGTTTVTPTIGYLFQSSAAQRFWSGYIGDVRFYNRDLSPGEVLSMYLPQTRWDLYQPLLPTAYYVPAAAPVTTVFRTTFSALGTRAGSRQVIG
jgi:hypothetical protein